MIDKSWGIHKPIGLTVCYMSFAFQPLQAKIAVGRGLLDSSLRVSEATFASSVAVKVTHLIWPVLHLDRRVESTADGLV